MNKLLFVLFACIVFFGCEDANRIEDSNAASACTDVLFPCADDEAAEYCLFGAKFGGANPMSFGGPEASGVATPGGNVTWTFARNQERYNSLVISTVLHPSTDPNDLPACLVDGVRRAFESWESVCDITFTEIDDFEAADAQVFFGTRIPGTGFGFPRNSEEACESFSSRIFLNTDEINCDLIDFVALHEIGHMIGLGHVGTSNIMGTEDLGFRSLQPGDVAGAQAIYGLK